VRVKTNYNPTEEEKTCSTIGRPAHVKTSECKCTAHCKSNTSSCTWTSNEHN